MYTFTVPGNPIGKARARSGKGGYYTPATTAAYERSVGWTARPLFNRPIEGPVRVEILAVFAPAKSWTEHKKSSAIGCYHTQKPDSDNVQKAILDALNGIAFKDDSQAADVRCVKTWGHEGKAVVSIRPLDGTELLTCAEIPVRGIVT